MRKYILFSWFFICFLTSNAQNFDDFQKARQEMMNNYQQFRTKVLTDYDNYLKGAWERFQGFAGDKFKAIPGPKIPPVYVAPAEGTPTVEPMNLNPVNPQYKPTEIPDVKPHISPLDPAITAPQITPRSMDVDVSFYGMSYKLPEVKLLAIKNIEPNNIAKVWGAMKKDGMKDAVAGVKKTVVALGLNDWFTLELVKKYSNVAGRNNSIDERILFVQFMMAQLGYDVRLGECDKDGHLVLLVPLKEHVYSRTYTVIDGKRFYYIFDDKCNYKEDNAPDVYTCTLPKDCTLGDELSLVIGGMHIDSGKKHTYNLTDGYITITGSVDETVMKMLAHYPSMDIAGYAQANILPEVRKSILDQIRPKLASMSNLQAVNALLNFVQKGFAYAPDGEFHGFEKYYFFEENLFYAKNDCEDRAIFLGYLVKNLLGLNVHLLGYPGHESSAVHFVPEDVVGDGYSYHNQKWIICDGTYIGAHAGMCMPDYRNTNPVIDYEY